jgi:hypothetical protein
MIIFFVNLAEELDSFMDRHKVKFTWIGVMFVSVMTFLAFNLSYQWIDLSWMF